MHRVKCDRPGCYGAKETLCPVPEQVSKPRIGYQATRDMEHMMTRPTLATLAIASVCYVMPAAADEVGVRVGPTPAPGVVVQGDRERDKTVIEKRGPVEDKTIIKKEHEPVGGDTTVIHHD
jgi:hypothetical protein